MVLRFIRLQATVLATLMMGYVGTSTASGRVNPIWVNCSSCGQKNNIASVPKGNPWDCHACGETNNK